MKKQNDHMDPDDKMKKNAGLVLSWFPFIGLVVSVFSVGLQITKGTVWSIEEMCSTFVSFGLWTLLTGICFFLFHRYLPFSMPYIKGKMKYVTIGVILFFIVLHVVFYIG